MRMCVRVPVGLHSQSCWTWFSVSIFWLLELLNRDLLLSPVAHQKPSVPPAVPLYACCGHLLCFLLCGFCRCPVAEEVSECQYGILTEYRAKGHLNAWKWRTGSAESSDSQKNWSCTSWVMDPIDGTDDCSVLSDLGKILSSFSF